jgi:hypothetical protein
MALAGFSVRGSAKRKTLESSERYRTRAPGSARSTSMRNASAFPLRTFVEAYPGTSRTDMNPAKTAHRCAGTTSLTFPLGLGFPIDERDHAPDDPGAQSDRGADHQRTNHPEHPLIPDTLMGHKTGWQFDGRLRPIWGNLGQTHLLLLLTDHFHCVRAAQEPLARPLDGRRERSRAKGWEHG